MAVPTTSSSNTAARLRSASLSRAPSNSTVSRPPSPRSGSADPMKRKESPKTSREAPMRPLTNGKIRTAPENPRMSKPPAPMSKAKSEQAMLAEMTAKKMETEKRLAESEAENGRLRREQEDAKVRERDLQKELEYAMMREKELEGKLAQSKEDLMSSDIRARKCLNDLLNLKGQIRIVTRTRPLMPDERKAAITYPGPERIEIQHKQDKYAYEFQKVMGPNYTQAAVFDEIGELVLNVLHGFNVAIIAYGQTGSGKTYTMRGGSDCDTQGVIPRAVNYLFQNTKRLEDIGWKFDLSASFVEVYNDEVFDLLSKTRNKITLKTMGLEYTEGLTVKAVQGKEHIEAILAQADKTRSVGTTKLNMSSSRSHAIFKLTVRSENTILQAEHTSSLHLVDLAGSERVKESGAEGSVLKEAAEINESLFHFQFCIRSLLEQKHVPFRNRTLTKLLSSCLAANDSKTMVVINLNPSQSQTAETKRSLDFARDMSKVEIKEVKPRR